MKKSTTKIYYCVVKTDKFGEYSLMRTTGNTFLEVRKKLNEVGYRVALAVSKERFIELQQQPNEGWFINKPASWSIKLRDFIKSTYIN